MLTCFILKETWILLLVYIGIHALKCTSFDNMSYDE